MTATIDVSRTEEVAGLETTVRRRFGGTDILMNNAGIGTESTSFGPLENWQRIIGVNLWGVSRHAVFCAANDRTRTTGHDHQHRLEAGHHHAARQSGVQCLEGRCESPTEALQHELRNTAANKISAHLMIPVYVFTGLTARGRAEKPAGAWTPEQTVDFMIERIDAGDFYILCPDNDVPRSLDERRILWAAGDIVENRPALSRWHPDHADAFAAFAKQK